MGGSIVGWQAKIQAEVYTPQKGDERQDISFEAIFGVVNVVLY